MQIAAHPSTEQVFRAAEQMPEPRLTAELRRLVVERAHGFCEYCRSQAKFATQGFSVEHIIAQARGGVTELRNLACQGCNNHKYDKCEAYDPVSERLVPLYHPRRDRWDEHFAWSGDYALMVGLTPVGRATVAALRLKREGVVNLRRVLFAHGLHPLPADDG